MKLRLLLLGCVCIWGWTFVATRICLELLRPIEIVGLRFVIGLPILLAIVMRERIPLAITAREARRLAAGGAILTVHFLIQAVALGVTSATHTGWIIAVSPLVIALAAHLLLGERIRRREVLGIAVATLGVLVLVSDGRLARLEWIRNWGDGLVLLSTLTWALYTVTTRDLSRARHPLAITVWVFTPLTLICALLMAVASRPPLAALLAAPRTLAALLFLGVLGTAAQWGWQEGVARLGATRAGLFLYLEPVATTVLAVPLLGESYGLAAAVGGLLILAGVWWAERVEALAFGPRPGKRGAASPGGL
jgi:drug/metabolite transporter (DMT)-like permease